MQHTTRPAARRAAIAAAALGAGALLAVAAPLSASAHVTVTPSTTGAGSYSVMTFAFGHGCEGSPTESIAITIPEQILSVTPGITPGWQVEKVMGPVEEPAEDSHGETVSERVAQVVYTADAPFEDGFRTTFDLQAQLPADAEGETLAFPTLQTCTEGETDWADDDQSADAPAPIVEVTAAEADAHGGGTDEHAEAAGQDDASAASSASATAGQDVLARVLGVVGLVVGVVGVVIAIAGRRRARS